DRGARARALVPTEADPEHDVVAQYQRPKGELVHAGRELYPAAGVAVGDRNRLAQRAVLGALTVVAVSRRVDDDVAELSLRGGRAGHHDERQQCTDDCRHPEPSSTSSAQVRADGL